MYTLFEHPKKVGELLRESFRLYQASVTKTLLAAVLLYVLIVIGGIGMGALGKHAQALSAANNTAQYHYHLLGFWFWFSLILRAVIQVLLLFWVVRAIGVTARQQDESIGGSFWFGIKVFPRTFLALILAMFVVFVGFICLVLPGIYLTPIMFLVVFAVIVDGHKPVAAVKEAAKLIWGNWWRVFGSLLLIMLIMMAGVMAFVIFISITIAIIHLPVRMTHIIMMIVAPLPLIFLYPWIQCFYFMIYHNLKLRRAEKLQIK
ncbi:MAG: hypothetical protein KAS93_07015 [Gammaproteobacteria bacterium]|nr:hypothetical protein [Gammaproteobacteria bacterium]